jgi:hypothetical protein
MYSICRCCWNIATYKWKVHNGKIEIISFVVKFRPVTCECWHFTHTWKVLPRPDKFSKNEGYCPLFIHSMFTLKCPYQACMFLVCWDINCVVLFIFPVINTRDTRCICWVEIVSLFHFDMLIRIMIICCLSISVLCVVIVIYRSPNCQQVWNHAWKSGHGGPIRNENSGRWQWCMLIISMWKEFISQVQPLVRNKNQGVGFNPRYLQMASCLHWRRIRDENYGHWQCQAKVTPTPRRTLKS